MQYPLQKFLVSLAAFTCTGVFAQGDQRSDSRPAVPLSRHGTPFLDDSSLNLTLRTFMDRQEIDDLISRQAWTESLQIKFESGYTDGLVGFGMDASAFLMLKVAASENAGNMVHIESNGQGSTGNTWAYMGRNLFKVRVGDAVVKYGLQQVSNPFMESKDNRGLPPTFRGATMVSKLAPSLNFEAGSFTDLQGRGRSDLQPLTSFYGGTRIERISYAGGIWDFSKEGNLSMYVSQAQDLWSQSYLSFSESVGTAQSIQWTGNANMYLTRDQGRALQGDIDNKAFSVSLSATRGAFTGKLSYQKVLGDQFFDYVGDTWGIRLANSVGVDFVAPHEQSLQISGALDGSKLGMRGLKVFFWATDGWGADGSVSARKYAAIDSPLHALYFKNGVAVHGSHQEFGILPSWIVQDGRLRGSKLSFIAVRHLSSAYYSDSSSLEYKFTIETPLKGL